MWLDELQTDDAGRERMAGRGVDLRLVLALGLVLTLSVLLRAPSAAARDVVQVESVGAAAVRPGSASPRDAAVRMALLEAVRQTARDLLGVAAGDEFADEPGGSPGPEAEGTQAAELDQILGSDPLEFATRFQVVEDRGEGPAIFGPDPEVELEYVVIVSVFVDRDRIREKLARAGMLAAISNQPPEIQSRLVLEGLTEFWVYDEIRKALLADLQIHSAIPREIVPGRVTLDLEATQSPSEILGPLQRAVSSRLELTPLTVGADEMRLRVDVLDPQPQELESPVGSAIDTSSPNRY